MKLTLRQMIILTSLFTLSLLLLFAPRIVITGVATSAHTMSEKGKLRCVTGILAGQQDCILTGDIVLTKAMVMSGMNTLDCQSHKISASGFDTTKNESIPQVAILARDMAGVAISNCTIEGFDFGIYAINSKGSGGEVSARVLQVASRGTAATQRAQFGGPNRFVHNVITSRFTGITLTSVDNTIVSLNTIYFPTDGGRGIVVQIDSDNNTIQKNTLNADGRVASNPLRAPGLRLPSNEVLPAGQGSPAGGAIQITQLGGPDATLLTAVIDGQVFQFKATDSVNANSDFTEANLVDDNTIMFPSTFPQATDGISLAVPHGTLVTNNKIFQATFGIRVGSQDGSSKTFPGQCSNDATRWCVANGDCVGGTCPTNLPSKTVQWFSANTTLEGNRIFGPFVGGILVAGRDTTVRKNLLIGPVLQTAGVGGVSPPAMVHSGIALLGKHALEATLVTQNHVMNASPAVSLQKSFQNLAPTCGTPCLGPRITLNDFTGYGSPSVLLDNANNLVFELSFNGQGNYWQLPCPGFNQQTVQKVGITGPITQVTDSHAYSQPVAGSSSPPAPCN
jgi:Right handed beta helix region